MLAFMKFKLTASIKLSFYVEICKTRKKLPLQYLDIYIRKCFNFKDGNTMRRRND